MAPKFSSTLRSNNKFYNYIYLDASRPGKYTYPGLYLSFLYEPFYVGKGTGDRWYVHLSHNYYKKPPEFRNRIFNIAKDGKDPIEYVEVLNYSDCEENSYATEEFLIRGIGRSRDGGTLSNKMFKASNNHQSEFMKINNPMDDWSTKEWSEHISRTQWSGDKGRKRRELHSNYFKKK